MANNKTYFGLDIYPHGIKADDIIMIPYDDYFNKISREIDGISYIDLLTWETYAKNYIYKNSIIFPDGVYTSNYTFGNGGDTKSNQNIFIDSTEELDETRHIKLKNEDLDSFLHGEK